MVRHGETDWNAAGKLQGQEDIPLNLHGHAQAKCAGLYLRQWQWDLLVSSHLSRATETARIIGQHIQIELTHQMAVFAERDYGRASGMTTAEIAAAFPKGAIPGAESRATVQNRVMQGLETLVESYPNRRIIVVAHGGVINAALARLSNGEIGSGKSILQNACVNMFRFNTKGWEIEFYNSVDHLLPV
jgi:uncharacterized phosphatase